jgi:replicative DNA helicase
MGYAGEGLVDDVVDRAQQEVYGVTDRRASEDYSPLSDIMEATLDEIEAISNRDGQMVGVPTGFADLDELTNGLHPGQMIIIAARPAMGKALALDTPLATPEGWTTMGDIEVGDLLYGADGSPTTVVAATEVLHNRPCYEVEFSDGTVIVADGQHQWLTETRAARKSRWAAENQYNRTGNPRTVASVVTTEEIAASVRVGGDERANHSVENARPLLGADEDLLIPGYVLGAWLGDGHTASNRITCETDEIPMYIESYGFVVRPLAGMAYSIQIPQDGPAERLCEVCGAAFMPAKSRPPTSGPRRPPGASCWRA